MSTKEITSETNAEDEAGKNPPLHLKVPDYARPLLNIPSSSYERILKRLSFLYGEEVAEAYMPGVERIMRVYYAHLPEELINEEKDFEPENRFTEKDIILITYGNLIRGNDRSPLRTLARFCDNYLEGNINTIHILPFFPYSSDRGFSIIDFETVDPDLGTWEDIEEQKIKYKLMFDGVFNHVSSKSRWFREFINGNSYYRDFFISFGSPDELTPQQRRLIFRPRTSDILTRVQTINGPCYVWTTFSEDQIDLNYKNPDVLMRIIEVILMYVRRGADIIRLDAVTYLWREPGTRCANLRQTHEIVKLFRDILNVVAPRVALITETNVPQKENLSYIGDGNDEAQMVYNFAFPPLILYTFYSEDTTKLSEWAADLKEAAGSVTFFNFLDSHDGIGLQGVNDLLSKEEIDLIIKRAEKHGSLVSYRNSENGEKEPYELNITWYSALNREDDEEDIAFQVKRFVASRVIALVLQGVPGIYLHSMIGTQNDINAVLSTHSNREINRAVIDEAAIYEALKDPLSKISRINRELGRLISIRTRQPAFHPKGDQRILRLSPRVFAVSRTSTAGDQHILTLINITGKVCHLDIHVSDLGVHDTHWYDIVSSMEWMTDGGSLHLTLLPFDVVWLTPLMEAGPSVTP